MSEDAARREHYRDFYAGPSVGPVDGAPDRPVLLVVGNCQAESLRLLLDGPDIRTVRMPAVHELSAEDAEVLQAWLPRTSYLVAQPVRDDYRDLRLGTAQLAALLPGDGRLVLYPVLRYAGLHPYQVIVHLPGVGDPPVVPYHDLRTVVAAAWAIQGRPVPRMPDPTPDAVRAIAAASLAELQRREELHGAVVASDLFAAPTFALTRTINHPGNAVLVPLAERIRAAAGLPVSPPTIDRPLLNALHAPRHPVVAAVFDPAADALPHWTVDGVPLSEATVAADQLPWCAARPELVQETLRRHANTCAVLELPLP